MWFLHQLNWAWKYFHLYHHMELISFPVQKDWILGRLVNINILTRVTAWQLMVLMMLKSFIGWWYIILQFIFLSISFFNFVYGLLRSHAIFPSFYIWVFPQKALDVIRMCKEEQELVFKMLAAILWLGNISFQDTDNENHIEVVNDEGNC